MSRPKTKSPLPASLLVEQKYQMRRSCRKTRNELGEVKRSEASQSICRWIESWPVFQRSSVILTYMPITGEVDLTSLLEHYSQKCWVLPRIIPEANHRMDFHRYEVDKLVRHPFGMDEPWPDSPLVPCKEVQLALVPGLAFDKQGWRLGYGGGYFDRFLCSFSGVSLGITFQALLLDALPHGEQDVAVEWVLTETGFLHPNPDRP